MTICDEGHCKRDDAGSAQLAALTCCLQNLLRLLAFVGLQTCPTHYVDSMLDSLLKMSRGKPNLRVSWYETGCTSSNIVIQTNVSLEVNLDSKANKCTIKIYFTNLAMSMVSM